MLTLHPRLAGSAAGEAAAGEDHDEGRVCYCVVVACVSLLLFVVLAAATTVAKACAITAAVVLLLALAGWLVPSADAAAPAATSPAGAVRLVVHHHRCACGLAGDAAIAALPAFAYEPAEGGDKPRGSSVLCAVCLEDVQAGEMVRQLPACRHLFHTGCVDAWLRAHRTCPPCRRELLSPRSASSKATVTPPPSSADDDALPPV